MNAYFYCTDFHNVKGPYTTDWFAEMIGKGLVGPETQVCNASFQPGQEAWHALKDVAELSQPSPATPPRTVPIPPTEATEQTQVDLRAIKEAGTDKLKPAKAATAPRETPSVAEEAPKQPNKAELLRAVTQELDRLWATQKASLVARITASELPNEHAQTRKRWKESYNLLERNVVDYWRRTRQFERWIDSLLWQETDLVRRLRGDSGQAKYDDMKEWLSKAKLWDEAGAYSFIRDGDYVYVGQTEATLGQRLTQHFRDGRFYADSTHLRIIIPRYKQWGKKVERLLLLAYKPHETSMPGFKGNNEADDCLAFLFNEVHELINDAD